MADRKARNRAPASVAKRAPATPPTYVEEEWDLPDPVPPFDPVTLDPSEFEWRPVPRRPRADGWTPDVQRAFIQALADTGMVESAARAVDMSVQSAYALRRARGAEGFAHAWMVACKAAAERVLDLAFQRAIEGEEIPVFDRDGCRIGARRKTNDRMTMFLLRAYMPERFRHAHESTRQPGEAPPPALPALADALDALLPQAPENPHLLLPPERLETLVQGARGVAEVDALYPRDDRELYVAPRHEDDHPRASSRALARRTRAFARRVAQHERGEDPGDDSEIYIGGTKPDFA